MGQQIPFHRTRVASWVLQILSPVSLECQGGFGSLSLLWNCPVESSLRDRLSGSSIESSYWGSMSYSDSWFQWDLGEHPSWADMISPIARSPLALNTSPHGIWGRLFDTPCYSSSPYGSDSCSTVCSSASKSCILQAQQALFLKNPVLIEVSVWAWKLHYSWLWFRQPRISFHSRRKFVRQGFGCKDQQSGHSEGLRISEDLKAALFCPCLSPPLSWCHASAHWHFLLQRTKV